MAKIYITEHARPTVYHGQLLPVVKVPPYTTGILGVGTSSITSARFGSSTVMVAIHTDAICSIEFGAAPTATTSSKRMAANTTEYFEVNSGDVVAVITNT